MPPPFINPEEDERAEETLTDPELAEYTIKVLPPLDQKAKPPSLRNYMVHQRDPRHPYIPYPSRMNQEKQQEKDEIQIHKFWQMFKQLYINITFVNALILIPKYQKILKALLSNKEKLLELENTPLNENCSAVILKKLPEKLGDPRKFLIPCGFSELKCKALADLVKYLFNHDPTTEMDSILEDSVDEGNLADPNNDLVDTIPEMFIDEHTLDYSSPPLYDDVDDDLVELESDNDDVYDDPFDSKGDKIKESKLLIDELDPHRSSDFLPSPECDSVLYEDFSKVDAFPLTNNEDKVFNPGILIHENLFEVTIRVTQDKNVKKISISNASLILEDFNPPLYELSFHKEVPGSKTLLSFSSKNEEKFLTPGFSLLKEFILLFS
nr:reverse transcriptase domain-containing protein [Tanacetum cinerariifolium]